MWAFFVLSFWHVEFVWGFVLVGLSSGGVDFLGFGLLWGVIFCGGAFLWGCVFCGVVFVLGLIFCGVEFLWG